jgi:two-component system sensor histidine kinase BaeS
MSLRARLALALAVVAIGTAGAIALLTPLIINRGFASLDTGAIATPGAGQGQGPGAGAGQGAGGGQGPGAGQGQGQHLAEVRESMILTIILVAGVAALVASLGGVWAAGRLVRPIRRLEAAAAAVAGGDLAGRSGLADRPDELGDLGRSFDGMAAALERGEEDRRRFMQDAVHELRTPLAVVEATTSAVLDGVYAHDDEHLRTIRDQARLLTRIVDDLRTISLAEGGRLDLHAERVDVAGVLGDAARDVEARAVEVGRTVAVEPIAADAAGVDLAVLADRDRVRQALAALLDNALRHTPPGGRVVLAGRAATGKTVRIEVRDTGPGIAAEDLPRVFDRLYQADPARDRRTGSSGLGLAIVRALVEAQGGRVGAGAAPEGGALVWMELPRA